MSSSYGVGAKAKDRKTMYKVMLSMLSHASFLTTDTVLKAIMTFHNSIKYFKLVVQ